MEFIREHMKPIPTTSNITSSLCNIEDINDSQGTAPFTPLSPEEPELDLFNSEEPVSTTTLSRNCKEAKNDYGVIIFSYDEIGSGFPRKTSGGFPSDNGCSSSLCFCFT
ncbi:uncharacterized protein LOC129951190 [Eupeodes corollae]|uniref:uncharacterized protein LOC129951190 n=1 Tax=Eupeodes corollae TaxID=290404 RepID=UPI002493CE01|nr:uncharacterized protein LOC129951190 [Eupeodes corollae]